MLELRNVSGGYGRKIIVRRVNASFKKGEFVSVIGANGSGKSTLLMLAAGLIPCTEGSVLIDGKALPNFDNKERAKHISYMEQMKTPSGITVRTFVSHGRFPYLGYPRRYTDHDREKIEAAMEMAGVSDMQNRMINELSGGQQQRVRLAMILAQDTDIILLDEPLTYLDVRYKLEMTELIAGLKNYGKAVIAVMHDPELAFGYSDKIAVMNEGSLTAAGPPADIAKSTALSEALGVTAEYCENFHRFFFRKN